MSERYARLQPLSIDTSAIQDSTVAVVGLGATGSHMTEHLARLGTNLILIDRDVLGPENLTTSTLYTEDSIAKTLPKAEAARRVQNVNTEVDIETQVEDVNSETIDRLLSEADLIMDGTDNLETRFLINEYAVTTGTPWIHVSALGYAGEVMPIIPGDTACFHCVFGDKNGAELETCETAGILNETAATAASIATTQAIDVLTNEPVSGLTRFNLKTGGMRSIQVVQDSDCPICIQQNYQYLTLETGTVTTALCGEHKYQVNPHHEPPVDLSALAERLQERGKVTVNEHLMQFESADASFTLFRSGRAIIDAPTAARAKTIYARFIGM